MWAGPASSLTILDGFSGFGNFFRNSKVYPASVYFGVKINSAGKIRQQLACNDIPTRPETSEQTYLRKTRNYCRGIPYCPQRFNHQMFQAAFVNFIFNYDLRT